MLPFFRDALYFSPEESSTRVACDGAIVKASRRGCSTNQAATFFCWNLVPVHPVALITTAIHNIKIQMNILILKQGALSTPCLHACESSENLCLAKPLAIERGHALDFWL